MATRRRFLKVMTGAGTAIGGLPIQAIASRYQTSAGYFGVHPFIEAHPEAVFIMRTAVKEKTDNPAKKAVGLAFGRSVFIPLESGGYPVSSIIPIKPNLKGGSAGDPIGRLGMNTDAYFTEGILDSLRELGVSGSQCHFLQTVAANSNGTGGSKDWDTNGWADVARRTGAHLRDYSAGVAGLPAEYLNWIDTPQGVWYRKIPYLWPLNVKNSFLLNISKFKGHGMGVTLCTKNMQGSVAQKYQAFCTPYSNNMTMKTEHLNPFAKTVIKENYLRHKSDGIPRWDKPGDNVFDTGISMETWVSRTLDNVSTMTFGLCVVEGIYGRDGDSGAGGPNPAGNDNNPSGKAWDVMTNFVLFGKNPLHTDVIGYWLGGHEPGNFGLFHIGIERGLARLLDPQRIPLYLWEDGKATLVSLSSFERTPLKSHYLTRNYNGGSEPYWHLTNEAYDYSKVPLSVQEPKAESPRSFVLHQNHPNPFNPYTSIEYVVPKGGQVRLEVYNGSGQLTEVLAEGWKAPGSHMAVWNAQKRASGTYYYRFRCGDFSEVRKMTLLK
ncbi:MAG: DUF362 domain-containing protein [Candidatus Latescibacterota bacterium]